MMAADVIVDIEVKDPERYAEAPGSGGPRRRTARGLEAAFVVAAAPPQRESTTFALCRTEPLERSRK
jgi:hypothetical protein